MIPIGTKVLLSVHSVELLALSNGARSIHNSSMASMTKRRCRYDSSGVPVRVSARAQLEAQSEMMQGRLQGSGGREDGSQYIYAWVDVCRSFAPREGMAYVTISITNKSSKNAVDTRGLFVKPADLRTLDSLPIDARAGVMTHVTM